MRRTMLFSARIFVLSAQGVSKSAIGLRKSPGKRRFASLFGVTPKVCSIVWRKISHQFTNRIEPKHLLWALLFLKCYGSESVHSALTGVDEKTFRLWVWRVVPSIGQLKEVSQEIVFCSISYPFYRLYGQSV